MSQFLPEGMKGGMTVGETSLAPAAPNVTQEDVALMQRVLRAAAQNPGLIPDDFMSYALDYIQTSGLVLPIGQIFGFAQFTAQLDRVSTDEATSLTAFGNLATVGPTISGLPDGNYVVQIGAITMIDTPGDFAVIGVSVNGVDPTEDLAYNGANQFAGISGASVFRLSNGGSNTLALKYRSNVGGVTASFANRWILALRYANL